MIFLKEKPEVAEAEPSAVGQLDAEHVWSRPECLSIMNKPNTGREVPTTEMQCPQGTAS